MVKTHCAWPTSWRISSWSSAPKIAARFAAQDLLMLSKALVLEGRHPEGVPTGQEGSEEQAIHRLLQLLGN